MHLRSNLAVRHLVIGLDLNLAFGWLCMREPLLQLTFCFAGTEDEKRLRPVNVADDFVIIDVELVLILPILRVLGDGRARVLFHLGKDDFDFVFRV